MWKTWGWAGRVWDRLMVPVVAVGVKCTCLLGEGGKCWYIFHIFKPCSLALDKLECQSTRTQTPFLTGITMLTFPRPRVLSIVQVKREKRPLGYMSPSPRVSKILNYRWKLQGQGHMGKPGTRTLRSQPLRGENGRTKSGAGTESPILLD